MYMNMSRSNFADQFKESEWGNSFSYDGLARIYRDLEELYDGNFEYDAGKIAAMYTEYDSIDDFNKEHSVSLDSYYESVEELELDRYILKIDGGGFIIVE